MSAMRNFFFVLALTLTATACSTAQMTTHKKLQDEVIEIEKAFARTMADRDLAAFSTFVSDEAIFFSEDSALTGKPAIVAAWTPFFKNAQAPFSWSPDHVEVLESGQLALSTGPVLNAKGDLVATFSSIWRRESSGAWHIVFDKGCDVCIKCGVAH
ncbi:ketosteroid isomerase-like protein [Oxalobacteraceae bacterium GrIS 2.11]